MANQKLVIPVGKRTVKLRAFDVRGKEISKECRFTATPDNPGYMKVSLPDWEKDPNVFEIETETEGQATIFWSAQNNLGIIQQTDSLQVRAKAVPERVGRRAPTAPATMIAEYDEAMAAAPVWERPPANP